MRAVCENLYLFIDGQLDEPAARFRAHLASAPLPPRPGERLVLDALAEQGLVAGERMNRTVEVPVAPAYPWAAQPFARPCAAALSPRRDVDRRVGRSLWRWRSTS